MDIIDIKNYKEIIRRSRENYFKTPYDLVYENFINLKYNKRPKEYFFENASSIVENLRSKCWDSYKPLEKKFTSEMLKKLVDEDKINKLNSLEAISFFIEEFPEHIYALSLSNTQSRRSRAGKEFESIIEHILIGAELPLDSQGNVGKKIFLDKGLGKLVDVVLPGVLEYFLNKRNTVLISAKTTLRERWQEVPEEMGRTGAREMFLATLDTTISDDVLRTLYEANIQVTTTRNIKDNYYHDNNRVLTFEDLLRICSTITNYWNDYNYSDDEKEQVQNLLNKQIEKHKNHEFIKKYYEKRLEKLK